MDPQSDSGHESRDDRQVVAELSEPRSMRERGEEMSLLEQFLVTSIDDRENRPHGPEAVEEGRRLFEDVNQRCRQIYVDFRVQRLRALRRNRGLGRPLTMTAARQRSSRSGSCRVRGSRRGRSGSRAGPDDSGDSDPDGEQPSAAVGEFKGCFPGERSQLLGRRPSSSTLRLKECQMEGAGQGAYWIADTRSEAIANVGIRVLGDVVRGRDV